jgi:hypothetical protein
MLGFKRSEYSTLFTIENLHHLSHPIPYSSAPAILTVFAPFTLLLSSLHISSLENSLRLVSRYVSGFCFSGRRCADVQDSYRSLRFITHSSWDGLSGPKGERRGSTGKELE